MLPDEPINPSAMALMESLIGRPLNHPHATKNEPIRDSSSSLIERLTGRPLNPLTKK